MSKVYITAVTVGGVSTPSHHALNVEINELCGGETLSLTQENGAEK